MAGARLLSRESRKLKPHEPCSDEAQVEEEAGVGAEESEDLQDWLAVSDCCRTWVIENAA